jgi:ligand-binding sensor domain-containing protein
LVTWVKSVEMNGSVTISFVVRIARAVLSLYAAIILITAHAQTADINLSRLTNQQGLSQASVNVLYKDKEGFLWIGTDDGLNRFDGKEVIAFYSNVQDIHSLSSNQVYGITEDKSGKLYFAHNDGGISCYNKATNQFTRISAGGYKGHGLSTDRVYGLLTSSDGNIWARTVNGVSRINPNNFSVTNFNSNDYSDEELSFNIDVIENRDYIWFGSRNKGLLRIRKNGRFSKFNAWDCKKHGYTVNGITRDKNDNLWVTTEKGLYRIVRNGTEYNIEPFYLSKTLFATENKVLLDEDSSKIWIGTSDRGIVIIDLKNKSNVVRITSSGITDNLINNGITYLLKDDEKTVFIGTDRGVNFYSPYTNPFNNYHDIFRHIPHFGHPVYAIYELPDQQLLLGNLNGLYLFNPSSRSVFKIPFHPVKDSSNIIYRIIPFAKNTYLLCTGSGVFELRNDKAFKISKPHYKELARLNNIAITNILAINDSIAYISSYTEGIFKWNVVTHKLTRYAKREDVSAGRNAPVDNRISNIIATKDNKLMVCTKNGFSLFDIASEAFENFSPVAADTTKLTGKNIKDAYDDGENIWITTFGQGLQILNKRSKIFKRFTITDGLPNNAVYAIIPDSNNNFWMPTNTGLAVLTGRIKKS